MSDSENMIGSIVFGHFNETSRDTISVNESAAMLKKITKLQQQIEELKCCGNCNGSYTTPNDACFCARYLKPTNAGYYCKAWQSDGQTRKEREI